MKRTLGFVLSAALVPAIASAQSADPNDPYGPQPTPTSPAPDPNPSTTTTTTVVTPAPQPPPQQPVVVVNPARTTVVRQTPESYEVVDAWNAPVFATGALVFAGSYGASAIVAATSDHPGADRLYVPVAGPWLALNDWGDCPVENPRCDENTTQKVLLVADGVFQAAGVITMVTGLLSPTSHTVYTRTASTNSIKVTPTHNGFAVLGRW